VFERQRRLVLTASMLAINGKIQREGDVVHLVAQRLFDLSEDLGRLGERDEQFPLPHGRGDEFARGNGAPDSRERPKATAPVREIYVPDLLIDRLKIKSRNFQ
jgi:error-prone DNA polymerase